jgi:HSP20 family protein
MEATIIATARLNPVAEMLPLQEVMRRLFEQRPVGPSRLQDRAVTCPMDVYAEGDNYVVEIALPGVEPAAVDMSVLGNQVTISGECAAPSEGRQYLHRERSVGRFERTLTLPTELDSDKAEAHYEHGVMRLTVPKAETAKPRQILLTKGK